MEPNETPEDLERLSSVILGILIGAVLAYLVYG